MPDIVQPTFTQTAAVVKGKASNHGIVHKADITVADLVADGGYLNTEQSNSFIDLMLDTPGILPLVRTVRMNSPKMEINKLGFASRVLRKSPGSSVTLEADQRAKSSTEKVTLTTDEYIAEVHIPYDVLEDSIERASLEDHIARLLAERVSLDLEEIMIMSDTDSTDVDLAVKDGFIIQAVSHVIDSTSDTQAVTKTVFHDGLKKMPTKYLRNRPAMRFMVSPKADADYSDSLANRMTVLGDSKVTSSSGNVAYGVPVIAASIIPDSKYLFTYPQNMILGIQRNISFETDKDIRARTIIIVVTLRCDFKYETEDAVVLYTGLDVD